MKKKNKTVGYFLLLPFIWAFEANVFIGHIILNLIYLLFNFTVYIGFITTKLFVLLGSFIKERYKNSIDIVPIYSVKASYGTYELSQTLVKVLTSIFAYFGQVISTGCLKIIFFNKFFIDKLIVVGKNVIKYIKNTGLYVLNICKEALRLTRIFLSTIIFGFLYSLKHIFSFFKSKYMYIGLGVIILLICLSYIPFTQFLKTVPNPKTISDFSMPASTLIYDRNGVLLYSSYNDTHRIPIKYEEIPQTLIDAVISAEDKNFYDHHGLDYAAITRSFLHNITHKDIEGGSTITQQLAKNIFLTNEKSIVRKVKEAVITLRIEHNLTKKQILELYFNTISFGGDTKGIEAAAQRYFGKHTKDLTKNESIFLASLPVGPSYLLNDPTNKNVTYTDRMKYVLDRMIGENKISQNEANKILAQKINLQEHVIYKRAPHAVDYILSKLQEEYGKEDILKKGLIVHTTIDLNIQNYVQQVILEKVTAYKNYNVTNAAVVVADPKTGDILSMVGSANYYDPNGGQYNVAIAPRQLGSAVKLITYALALETNYKPESAIVDAPVKFQEYPDYKPRNYDGKFHGTLTIKSAFANSYNIPALVLGYKLGLDKVGDMGYQMGITEYADKKYNLSMVLGGKEMSLVNLTQAYAVVANDGKKVDFNPFLSITDYQGNVIYQKENPQSIRVLSSQTAQNIYNILSDNNARLPAFGRSQQLEFGSNKIGIKTGTSNNDIDNTAFAFSPDLVVGTWMGNNNNTPMRNISSGYVGASSIMHDVTAKMITFIQDKGSIKDISLTVNNYKQN